ncbi:Ig domain-containing protein [Rubinisphaera margarita]|uniref:Ig domain-containing protein n=1 Tax=Rubinisphaera margarita TaxID=2909586 RepID=UPI001EE8BE91|nr:Ig domain-containing protein [Rubinisphaera margarita]MCG6155195.1 Ig domain-containing protein [Rubinisphaera margarita]
MQQREKILLISLIAVVVFWWARPVLLQSFLTPLEEQRGLLQSAQNRLEEKQAEQDLVLTATRQLAEFREQSLPADPYEAQRDYTAWLTDQIEAAKWAAQEVTPGKITRFENLGSAVQIRVEGVATAASLSRFLSAYESSGILHRLERTRIESQSIEPGNLLDVSFTTEAIALSEAKREELEADDSPVELTAFWSEFTQRSPFSLLPPQVVQTPTVQVPSQILVHPGERLQQKVAWAGFPADAVVSVRLEGQPDGMHYDEETRILDWQTSAETTLKPYPLSIVVSSDGEKSLDARQNVVVDVRYPNTPPTLSVTPSHVVYAGAEWQYQVSAKDDDQPQQMLSYSLQGSRPEGISIDSRTGLVRWTPPESSAGQLVTVEVAVSDNGNPSRQSQALLRIDVQRDLEPTTQLVGCLQVDGEWTAWFREKDSQDRYQLTKGDRLEVGRYQGRIAEIEVDRIVVEREDGKDVLRVGNLLTERTAVN